MNKRAISAFYKLAVFSVTLILAVYVYYLFFPVYGRTVLTLTGLLLGTLTESPAIVSYAEQKGILVMSPAFEGVMMFKFDLFSICLNVIFAPALVVMTVGWKGWGWLRVCAAVLIMLLLHTSELVVTLLRFLTESSNPLIPSASAGFAAFAKWLYSFLDKMGYTLFPFLAWLVVCANALSQWSSGGRSARPPATVAGDSPPERLEPR